MLNLQSSQGMQLWYVILSLSVMILSTGKLLCYNAILWSQNCFLNFSVYLLQKKKKKSRYQSDLFGNNSHAGNYKECDMASSTISSVGKPIIVKAFQEGVFHISPE